jgi:tetratricopeptide (TPR) repeat protein
VYVHTGDLTRALADYDAVIAADPTRADGYFNRALIRARQNRDDLVVADFTTYIQIVPSDAEAFVQRGSALFRMKQFDRALADFTQAVTLEPRNAAALFGRGATKQAQGDLSGGGSDITAARRLEFDVVDMMGRRGVRAVKLENQSIADPPSAPKK